MVLRIKIICELGSKYVGHGTAHTHSASHFMVYTQLQFDAAESAFPVPVQADRSIRTDHSNKYTISINILCLAICLFIKCVCLCLKYSRDIACEITILIPELCDFGRKKNRLKRYKGIKGKLKSARVLEASIGPLQLVWNHV